MEWLAWTKDDLGVQNLTVMSLTLDGDGHLWISSGHLYMGGGHGLSRFDGAAWTVFDSRNSGLPHPWVRSVALDHEGYLWVGTDSGLARFDGQEHWQVHDINNSGLPDDSV